MCHPLGGVGFIAQQAQIPGRGPEGIRHAAEAQQAGVGVRTVREPPQHDGQQGALDGRASAHSVGQ